MCLLQSIRSVKTVTATKQQSKQKLQIKINVPTNVLNIAQAAMLLSFL